MAFNINQLCKLLDYMRRISKCSVNYLMIDEVNKYSIEHTLKQSTEDIKTKLKKDITENTKKLKDIEEKEKLKRIKSSVYVADDDDDCNIALDDGNYAAQPNNRIIWDIPSFTVKDNIPDWKVQTNEWNVEDSSQWRTEDTDKFFYEIEEKKK